MAAISENEFKEMVKEARKDFITPYDLAYKAFTDLGYDLQTSEYFRTNASDIVEKMREQCWAEYVPYEKEFMTDMLRKLIDTQKVSSMDPVKAIESFVEEYPQHIYQLALSNTQSRRSRAGKEFEAIIELLLMGCDVPADSQGNIGKSAFKDQGLGKLVDFVSPGVVQYLINKRNTTLISAKTTLRERWQEVPEEVTRTGSREMYLATLDDNITVETLKVLYEANVTIVTTKRNQHANYFNDTRVISFEDLIDTATDSAKRWNTHLYTEDEKKAMANYIKSQRQKHHDHPFVKRYYDRRLDDLKNCLS